MWEPWIVKIEIKSGEEISYHNYNLSNGRQIEEFVKLMDNIEKYRILQFPKHIEE